MQTNKDLCVAVNSLFDPLERKRDDKYESLLRNKSSFVSLISKDDFVSSGLMKSTNSYFKDIIRYVYFKFKRWVASFYESHDQYFMTSTDLALYERDFFGTVYDVVGDEEYDLDNILI